MQFRTILFCLILHACATLAAETPLTSITFGSCCQQNRPQPIWETIVAIKPQLFLFIGDTIYGDSADMTVLKAKYDKLDTQPGFKKLRSSCTVMGTWDDHDYGRNDSGAEFPAKAESQKLFLDFFNEPADSPRRKREGVYDARLFGPQDKSLQIILLDTRYHRGPIKSPTSTMLGDAQWKWLEEQLKTPARIRIIASSIQFAADEHRFESWGNLAHVRAKLIKLLKDCKTAGVMFISGDRHLGELTKLESADSGLNYPLYDLTSSALNQRCGLSDEQTPNRRRLGNYTVEPNFGVISINWAQEDPAITLELRDIQGAAKLTEKLKLSTLLPK